MKRGKQRKKGEKEGKGGNKRDNGFQWFTLQLNDFSRQKFYCSSLKVNLKKKSTMTYHRPLYTGNVLKVRFSCEKKTSKKTGEKNYPKKHGKGKKKIGYEYIPLVVCSVQSSDQRVQISQRTVYWIQCSVRSSEQCRHWRVKLCGTSSYTVLLRSTR